MTDAQRREPQTEPTPGAPQPEHLPTPKPEPLERGDATGGAMTGETGVLSPENEPEPFVPAERREIEDPAHHGLASQLHHSAVSGERPKSGPPTADPTE
jgi:hypothetical protein